MTQGTSAGTAPAGGQAGGNGALWGGRFEARPAEFLQRYGASLPFDKRMWAEDIAGSKAHAAMLAKVGVVSAEDADAIRAGLDAVGADIAAGDFSFDINDEDIHMSVERSLTERIGAAGGRLHTGRSRNDQVALDDRLVARRAARELHAKVLEMRAALLERAEGEFGVVMPGYTHMQKAQPVLFSHHMLAYYWMFARDAKRLRDAYDAANVCPLGSAALAGTTYPLDRAMVAEELGFAGITANSMDAVSDRDFFCDLVYACAMAQMHLSRLCEELVWWSSDEFRFVTMDDTYSTGSSIMPQKKNPDFAELTRGKTGRVYGDLVSLLTMLKGLPLAYNKDMQEDKEPVFDALDTLSQCIPVFTAMVDTMTVLPENMRTAAGKGFLNATDCADYLTKKGMPFRDAYKVSGQLVYLCTQKGCTLEDLSLTELKRLSPLFAPDVYEAISLDTCVSQRKSYGGPAPEQTAMQIAAIEGFLAAHTK